MEKHGIQSQDDNRATFAAINQEDGSGMIKYSEFVAATLDKAIYEMPAQIEAAFHR